MAEKKSLSFRFNPHTQLIIDMARLGCKTLTKEAILERAMEFDSLCRTRLRIQALVDEKNREFLAHLERRQRPPN